MPLSRRRRADSSNSSGRDDGGAGGGGEGDDDDDDDSSLDLLGPHFEEFVETTLGFFKRDGYVRIACAHTCVCCVVRACVRACVKDFVPPLTDDHGDDALVGHGLHWCLSRERRRYLNAEIAEEMQALAEAGDEVRARPASHQRMSPQPSAVHWRTAFSPPPSSTS